MRWRVAVVALALMSTGCVYYNGIYNAQSAAGRGDSQLRHGGESEASRFFQQSAATAESVLVRHPQSTWRERALYLAARGAALGGQCDQAVPRLREYLALPTRADLDRNARRERESDRDRARVALASCDLRGAHVGEARARLDSLVDAPDRETARQARVWAARAALAGGDRDAVTRYLGDLDDGAMSWELLSASLSAREYARVESLLVRRAARADYRDDVAPVLRELWAAGQWSAVENVVRGYDAARLRDAARATMHFTVGDLNLRAGQDSMARVHLALAQTLAGRDSVVERESAARLQFMAIMRAASMRVIDSVDARADSATRRTPYARRMQEQLLLVRLLLQVEDPTGASMYLAAEVARDSLRAPAVARELFLRVARERPNAPLAPSAWYAAGRLLPDSAADWQSRIRREYASSAVAAWLNGDDPALRADFATAPELLQARWNQSVRVWSDSVRRLRAAPRPGDAQRTRRP